MKKKYSHDVLMEGDRKEGGKKVKLMEPSNSFCLVNTSLI